MPPRQRLTPPEWRTDRAPEAGPDGVRISQGPSSPLTVFSPAADCHPRWPTGLRPSPVVTTGDPPVPAVMPCPRLRASVPEFPLPVTRPGGE